MARRKMLTDGDIVRLCMDWISSDRTRAFHLTQQDTFEAGAKVIRNHYEEQMSELLKMLDEANAIIEERSAFHTDYAKLLEQQKKRMTAAGDKFKPIKKIK